MTDVTMSCFVLDSNFVSFANLGVVFIHHMFISVVSGSGGKDSIVKTIGRVIYCTEEAILQKHCNISVFLYQGGSYQKKMGYEPIFSEECI